MLGTLYQPRVSCFQGPPTGQGSLSVSVPGLFSVRKCEPKTCADSISVDEVATSLQQNLLSQELCHACEPEFEGLP